MFEASPGGLTDPSVALASASILDIRASYWLMCELRTNDLHVPYKSAGTLRHGRNNVEKHILPWFRSNESKDNISETKS